MHSRAWDNTIPADTALAGDGADELRKLKLDIAERLDIDHHMSGELDDTKSSAEGRHKKVTMTVLADDPAHITGTAILYMKADGLYYRTADGIFKV